MKKLKHPRNVLRLPLFIAVAAPTLLACDEEKPYTPFEVATALPDEKGAPKSPTVEEVQQSASLRPSVSQQAPRLAQSWAVFDRTLKAPVGTHFLAAIPIPADESDRLLVWTAPMKGQPLGESGLWTFSMSGTAESRILPFPEYLPQGDDCHYRSALEKTGERSLRAQINATCRARILPGTPTQTVAVVAPHRGTPVLIHLRFIDPNAGESLGFVVNSEDRDDDGSDDVELLVSLTAPSGKKESLPLRWLTRSAGASRQSDFPRKELAKRASRLSTASVRKAERDQVPDQIDALRRLLAAMCAEFATPKVADSGGAALKCGDLRSTLDRLTYAVVQALLGEKKPRAAVGEVQRASWFGNKTGEKQKEALAKLILSKVEHKKARQIVRFDVATRHFSGPFASPLRFSEDGQLWAQTPDGKTKRLTFKGDPPLVTPATEEEQEKKISPPEWDLLPEGPGGKILGAVLPSCQRSEIQLSVGRPGEPQTALTPVSMLAPRPGNCRTYSELQIQAIPIQWLSGQLHSIIGGQLISTGGHDKSLPTSVAWSTSLGIALQRGKEFSIWTGDITRKTTHCVVSEGGEKIACVKGDSVVVFSRIED